MAQGDLENALLRNQEALEIFLKTLEPSHASVATTETNIGNILSAQGDYENALLHHWRSTKNAFGLRMLVLPPHMETLLLFSSSKGNFQKR